MPTRRSTAKKSHTNPSSQRKVVAVHTTTAEPVALKPVKEVVTEQTEVTTEPEVEVRKPATLAEALTQPPVAVVKAKTRVRRRVIERKRVA
jgi:hypothetical protein